MRRLVLTLLLGLVGTVAAHPVDEMVQGAYLTLAPGVVQLELDLTPGSQVAQALLKTIDTDRDGRLSSGEARAFALRVLAQSSLSLSGVPAPWTLDQVVMPPYQSLITGNDEIKIYASAKRTDRVGTAAFSYENRYRPVKSSYMANVFLLPGAGWQYAVSAQGHGPEGRSLSVSYRVNRP